MDYISLLFLNHLPDVREELRIVDGKEMPCLILPTEPNQIKKGKGGNWLMYLRMSECDPNARQQTHWLQLGYLDYDNYNKSVAAGYYKRTQHLGRVYEHDHTPEKKVDRRNNATDMCCRGVITLSDIPKELIVVSGLNRKRYVTDLCFKSHTVQHTVYTGCICIDDIPRDEIQTDANTGKRYINAAFIRMPKLDTYMNTHHLVIMTKDGSEIEIGRFREWVADGKANPGTQNNTPVQNGNGTEHTTTVNPRDTSFSIDGIEF